MVTKKPPAKVAPVKRRTPKPKAEQTINVSVATPASAPKPEAKKDDSTLGKIIGLIECWLVLIGSKSLLTSDSTSGLPKRLLWLETNHKQRKIRMDKLFADQNLGTSINEWSKELHDKK